MTSQIDPTVPIFGAPTTESVRQNFGRAGGEITALQEFQAWLDSRVTALEAIPPWPEAPAGPLIYGRNQGAWSQAVRRAGDTMTGALSVNTPVPGNAHISQVYAAYAFSSTNLALNMYADTGGNSVWRHLSTGYGAVLGIDPADGVTQFYTFPTDAAGNVGVPSSRFQFDPLGNFNLGNTLSVGITPGERKPLSFGSIHGRQYTSASMLFQGNVYRADEDRYHTNGAGSALIMSPSGSVVFYQYPVGVADAVVGAGAVTAQSAPFPGGAWMFPFGVQFGTDESFYCNQPNDTIRAFGYAEGVYWIYNTVTRDLTYNLPGQGSPFRIDTNGVTHANIAALPLINDRMDTLATRVAELIERIAAIERREPK